MRCVCIGALFSALVAVACVAQFAVPQDASTTESSTIESDEQMLKAAGMGFDNASLLQFFRNWPPANNAPIDGAISAATARLLAARQADGAIETLLNVLPGLDQLWLEDEILTSLGRLTVRHGQPDAALLAALKAAQPTQRAAAAYILGRRADAKQRNLVRALLGDPVPIVRLRAAQGLLGKPPLQAVIDHGPGDEARLKADNIAAVADDLLEFLRRRTPSAAEQVRLTNLVTDLGSIEYADRQRATQSLIQAGTPALAFLKPALLNSDVEVARRARRCIEEIQRGPAPALSIAVVRRLAGPGCVQDVSMAIRILLDFVPFALDDLVEDEVLNVLAILNLRKVEIDPALPAALDDALPARRAAAAFVLGSVGTQLHVAAASKLLDDASPLVRLRCAQGLLAAREKAAVPTLIGLLREIPPAGIWRVEAILNRLAGEQGPDATSIPPTLQARQKAIEAWNAWWHERKDRIDLARADEPAPFLGLITVCEYDNIVPGKLVGQAWEGPRLGPLRCKVADLVGPMDAQMLPNGRILVAENGANRITERDRGGTVKWDCPVQGGNPICCQRLPNGNTFVAMYNQFLEVQPDRTEVYRYNPGPQFYIFGARKTRTGTVVCVTDRCLLLEIDPLQNKTLKSINLGTQAGGWAGVEPLDNGNFLVATMNNSTVREVDAQGATIWSFNTIPGVFRATQLPTGNILVVSMNHRDVVEVDRKGAVRWKRTCQGRPWSVHFR